MAAVEGWYDDGQRPGKFRWWDGEKWTGFYSDAQAVLARGEGPGSGELPPSPHPVPPRNLDAVPDVAPATIPAPERAASVVAPAVDPVRSPPRQAPIDYRFAGSIGWPNADIAGESFHESEIVAALGRRPKIDEELEVTVDATLVPEPHNPHDSNAISVRIKGKVVGYLPRETAPLYKGSIDRITASGHVPTTTARVWASVRKSWDESKSRMYSNVRLHLPEPHLLIPLNDPPAVAYSLIPWGSGLQVLGEEKHFDVLAPFVNQEGRGLLIVSLHREKGAEVRSKEFIEVRVDGRRAGQMSPAMSMHYFPTVDHLAKSGTVAAAWAHLKGSGLAAEIVLQAAKASEVEMTWLDGHAVTVARLVPPAASYELPGVASSQPSTDQPKARTGNGLIDRISRGFR
jgi:hypothetical protein